MFMRRSVRDGKADELTSDAAAVVAEEAAKRKEARQDRALIDNRQDRTHHLASLVVALI
jgi:hypothetical protein